MDWLISDQAGAQAARARAIESQRARVALLGRRIAKQLALPANPARDALVSKFTDEHELAETELRRLETSPVQTVPSVTAEGGTGWHDVFEEH